MGYNTLVLLKNDCLGEYRDNAQELIDKICRAAGAGDDSERLKARNQDPYIQVKGASCEIISVHHADDVTLVLAGHNSAFKIGATFNRYDDLNEKESQFEKIKQICNYLGYKLTKKKPSVKRKSLTRAK